MGNTLDVYHCLDFFVAVLNQHKGRMGNTLDVYLAS